MSRLALVTTLVGIGLIAVRLPGVLAPARYRAFLVSFPRSKLWGRVLITVVGLIVWVIMLRASRESDEWRWAQPFIVVGVPVVLYLIYRYGVHYLALRATAALLLLVAKQMVDAADLSETPLRLIVTVLAYVWVIAAMWMAAAPHHFRDLIGWTMASDRRCRRLCSAGVVFGGVLVGLGLFVY
ncbi:MAG: hypothetical protein N3B01_05685 [Verrucomicrobiae bacterium]|nr:hypothetical protein [Verrucomicrobiae bacterium]